MSNSGKVWDIREAYKKIRNNEWSRGDIGLASSGTSANGTINKVQISTTGNAVGYGNLITAATANGGAMSGNQTRALFAGGDQPSVSNVISYKEFISDGNFADFGDLTTGRQMPTGTGNGTRGIFAGGRTGIGPTVPSNVIDAVSFASLGNATDFGDLTVSRIGSSSMSSPTRGVFAGGGSPTNVIDFITFSSAGNATDFGDIGTTTSPLNYFGGVNSETKGVFAGGGDPSNASIIASITMASTGNSQDFGDLTQSRILMAGASNSVRGLFFGGQQNTPGGPESDVIDFVTIASSGNATDFGDVSGNSSFASGGTSNGHGGLVFGEIQPQSVTYMPGSGRTLVFGGNRSGGDSKNIDMFQIPTLGNASDFGDLTVINDNNGACASTTRSICDLGSAPSDTYNTHIESIQFQSQGNSADFGDATVATNRRSGFSSTTRGVFAGGATPSGNSNVMDYVTIATAGNATDFGDLTVARQESRAVCSPTRGVVGGGYTGSYTNVMDYVTIASTGDAQDFGDLTAADQPGAGLSNSIRGLFAGGDNGGGTIDDEIQYITIASTSNTTDFGDLTQARNKMASGSTKTRGCCAGGQSPTLRNTIDYVTIDSTGNAIDFGDLTDTNSRTSGTSDAHGGLQA
jgi:hypothetical protein